MTCCPASKSEWLTYSRCWKPESYECAGQLLMGIVLVFYYVRVIVKMNLEPGEADAQLVLPLSSAIALCAVETVLLGILPVAVNLAQNVVVPAMIR